MAALGWTKGGNRMSTAGSMMDAPAAIRTVSINSYPFRMPLVVDMLFSEFHNFTGKTKLVFCNLQIDFDVVVGLVWSHDPES
jgi:hypothetical protein